MPSVRDDEWDLEIMSGIRASRCYYLGRGFYCRDSETRRAAGIREVRHAPEPVFVVIHRLCAFHFHEQFIHIGPVDVARHQRTCAVPVFDEGFFDLIAP